MPETTKPIRVGLMRCDTHGLWFGAQMQPHDARLLERAVPDPDDSVETWLRRGVHFFFYSHYCAPWRMTAPRVEGFEITRIWDRDRRLAEIASGIFDSRPIVCDRIEEVSDNVDLVFIADCNGDGSDHLELSRPGLEKGVATFIDKPFAGTFVDVLRILALAKRHDAPVLSLSILQTNPATARLALRAGEVGKVSFGSVTGFSTHPAALIHGVSIAHHVFGTGVETVRTMRTRKHTTVHLDYGDRDDRPEHGVTIECGTANFRFTNMYCCLYGREGAVQGEVMSDWNASEGSALILEHVRDMVRTRVACPLGNEMAEGIAVMEAAIRAEESGRAIRLAELKAEARQGA